MNYKYKTESSDPNYSNHLGLLKKFDALNVNSPTRGEGSGRLNLNQNRPAHLVRTTISIMFN
ncbi:hypothetical protein [Vibrio phage J14]|nr:hypothetical protein [Vibrio phage J14]